MANHALVVGCDAYPTLPDGGLRGAVADALAVRDWLLLPDGGDVPPSCMTFLASCSKAGSYADPSIITGPAGRKVPGRLRLVHLGLNV